MREFNVDISISEEFYYNIINIDSVFKMGTLYFQEKEEWYSFTPVPGDGSCLFYSLSYLLFNRNIHRAQDLRMQCCEYVRINGERFNQFIASHITEESLTIDDYILRLQDPRSYGDHIEILCLAEIYNFSARVYVHEGDTNLREYALS